MTKIWLAGVALAASSCNSQQPQAPTAQQSDQLNEAEGMLNDLATNEEGPEDRPSSPSNSSE